MAKKKATTGRLLRVLGGDWLDDCLAARPNPRAMVRCEIETDAGVSVYESAWSKAPDLLKDTLLLPYPLCTCGRRRIGEADRKDGYTKCAFCRNQETCDWCGKTPVRVSLVNRKRHCPKCLPLADQPCAVGLTSEVVETIRAEAARFAAARCLEVAEAEIVIGIILRDVSKTKLNGWSYYYVTEGGEWYGSHLPQAAMTILQYLALEPGNNQNRLFAWIQGGPFRGTRHYFHETQVEGKSMPLPQIPLGAVAPKLAEFLCKGA